MLVSAEKELSKKTREAICLYGGLLEITRKEFGDKAMSEQVITTAVQTAGYITWRFLMGGKFNSQKTPGEDGWEELKPDDPVPWSRKPVRTI